MGLLRLVEQCFVGATIRDFGVRQLGSLMGLRRRVAKRRSVVGRIGILGQSVETFESRLVLYAASGNAWPSSQVVTLSFQPDGTNLGGVNSNLNQAFNNNADLSGRWQNEILRAAQVWAEVTNLNFVVVSDSGAASGSGKYQQGDATFGDIRIGGYNFGTSSLARAFMPPQDNNYSIAGDIVFNTGVRYGIGINYDLFTVAVHEIGHALGLDHTSVTSSSVLFSSYNGIKSQLVADDIAGIRSIYSGSAPRTADDYDLVASNQSFGTATDVTSEISKTKSSAVIGGLDLTTATDVDFYKVTIPKWADSGLTVTVQSAGLSQLSAKVTVFDSDQKTVLGIANGLGKFGGTFSVPISNPVVGKTYYIKVEGADDSAFAVGTYGLIIDLGAKSSPTVAAPKTTKANGRTPSSGGGVAEGGGTMDEFLASTPVIQTISPDTGISASDRTTNSPQIVLSGVGSILGRVEFSMNGQVLGSVLNLLGFWSFQVPGSLSDGTYSFTARGFDLLGNPLGTSDTFTVKIDTQAPDAPVMWAINGPAGNDGSLIVKPTQIKGTGVSGQLITIHDFFEILGTTTVDGYGNWSLTINGGLADGTHRLTATATDQAGNVGRASAAQTVIVDSSISTPELTGVTQDTGISDSDNVTQSRNIQVNGIAEAGSTVTLYRDGRIQGTTVTTSNGTWTFNSTDPTGDGTYSFTALAVDPAGNRSDLSRPLTVTVDNQIAAPSISFVTRTTSLLLIQTLTVQGRSDPETQVELTSNGSRLGTATTDANGIWTYQFNTLILSSGVFRFAATAEDRAGNQPESTQYDLIVGSGAPVVSSFALFTPLTLTLNGLLSITTTPTLTGVAPKGSTISLFDGTLYLGSTTTGANGRWSFNSPALSKGRHNLVAVAEDSSGHGLPSSVLTFLV